MRAIVRFSIDGEKTGALRNKLASVLETAGFVRNPNVTATYEHSNINEADLSSVMQHFWGTTTTHKGAGHIDHFWMNSDNPPDAKHPKKP